MRLIRGRHDEGEYPAVRRRCRKLLDQGSERRRNALPAAREHDSFDFLEAAWREPCQLHGGEAMVVFRLSRAADDVTSPEVGEVVGEGGQRFDDVIDIGDVAFPLDLLTFPCGELLEVDTSAHGTITFLPAPIPRARRARCQRCRERDGSDRRRLKAKSVLVPFRQYSIGSVASRQYLSSATAPTPRCC